MPDLQGHDVCVQPPLGPVDHVGVDKRIFTQNLPSFRTPIRVLRAYQADPPRPVGLLYNLRNSQRCPDIGVRAENLYGI